jgi:hypothetical protein
MLEIMPMVKNTAPKRRMKMPERKKVPLAF